MKDVSEDVLCEVYGDGKVVVTPGRELFVVPFRPPDDRLIRYREVLQRIERVFKIRACWLGSRTWWCWDRAVVCRAVVCGGCWGCRWFRWCRCRWGGVGLRFGKVF